MVSATRLIPFIIAAIIAGGCEAHAIPPHTHFWTRDGQQNLWSYQRVARLTSSNGDSRPDAFLSRQLYAGETATLENGAVISFDGSTLRVGAEEIHSANAFMEGDCRIQPNAFIRTFD
jgi:hypothetical protein